MEIHHVSIINAQRFHLNFYTHLSTETVPLQSFLFSGKWQLVPSKRHKAVKSPQNIPLLRWTIADCWFRSVIRSVTQRRQSTCMKPNLRTNPGPRRSAEMCEKQGHWVRQQCENQNSSLRKTKHHWNYDSYDFVLFILMAEILHHRRDANKSSTIKCGMTNYISICCRGPA